MVEKMKFRLNGETALPGRMVLLPHITQIKMHFQRRDNDNDQNSYLRNFLSSRDQLCHLTQCERKNSRDQSRMHARQSLVDFSRATSRPCISHCKPTPVSRPAARCDHRTLSNGIAENFRSSQNQYQSQQVSQLRRACRAGSSADEIRSVAHEEEQQPAANQAGGNHSNI